MGAIDQARVELEQMLESIPIDPFQDRRELEQVLVSLHSDLTETGQDVAVSRQVNRRAFGASRELLELLRERPGDSVRIPDRHIAGAFVAHTLDPHTATLDGLATSGGLSLLDDSELQALLLGWPRRLRDTVDDEKLAERMSWEFLMPAFGQAGDVSEATEFFISDNSGQHELTDRDHKTSLFSSAPRRSAIAQRMGSLTQVRGSLETLAAETQVFLEQLDQRRKTSR